MIVAAPENKLVTDLTELNALNRETSFTFVILCIITFENTDITLERSEKTAVNIIVVRPRCLIRSFLPKLYKVSTAFGSRARISTIMEMTFAIVEREISSR